MPPRPPIDPAAPPIAAPTEVRRYKAARPDRIAGGFLGGGFPRSTRQETRLDLRGLVAHARHAAQNVDYVRSFEMMVRRHVIGRGGIALQAQATEPDGTRDTLANRIIESAWTDWGRRGTCTACGRLSWWQVENIAATALAREGNFFLRTRIGPDRGRFGFQIQVLSVDLLDLDYTVDLGPSRHVEAGIEYDEEDRVLAFHFFTKHPAESRPGVARVRVPAAEIIHAYRPAEPMQTLGVPHSHTALRRFNMLAQYEEAALTAAHFGAAAMVFFKSPSGPDLSAPERVEVEEIEAGTTATLPPGVDLAPFTPNYPDGDMPAFSKAMVRGGAAGLGVSYAGLSSDMEGANFSSLRDGRGEERDEWRMFQRDLAETLHGEVFRRWLPVAILAGAIPLPLSKLAKFERVAWRGRGWASVNPKDDAEAHDAELRNRLRAPSDIVAERGEDFEDLARRIAADLETLRAAGVPVPDALDPEARLRARPAPSAPPRPADPEAPT